MGAVSDCSLFLVLWVEWARCLVHSCLVSSNYISLSLMRSQNKTASKAGLGQTEV